MPNALTQVEALLADEATHVEVMAVMRSNLGVIIAGHMPTRTQFLEYLGWMRDGLRFTEQLLGSLCVVPGICFYDKPLCSGWGYDFCAYAHHHDGRHKDVIAIGLARAARQASVAHGHVLAEHEHDGISGKIFSRSGVMLEMMEECFHYYQIRIIGRPLPPNVDITAERNHPLEIEWRAYRDKIIADGWIVLRPT